MSVELQYYSVNKFDLELALSEAVDRVFYEELDHIFPKIIRNTSNEKYFKEYILKRLPDHNWSTLKEEQNNSYGPRKTVYFLEMFGFVMALSRRLLRHSWTYIQASNGDREFSDNSENSDADEKPKLPYQVVL
ncbi:hypothetical protein RclHR1_00150058 [Rhizophagus clarus]|uniref:Uncharacterized protein n=1 Tax=Rhizophagus clarus TaxID=94130 RepID=A0A2Z6QIF5_9GLOM|nr:hypothetical protein RclHR1_00150058 [Rhizophagus clarus]